MEDVQNKDNTFRVIVDSWNRRKWWLTALFVLSVSVGITGILALPQLYRSTTTMLLGQNAITESLVISNQDVQLEQRLHFTEQEVLSREQLLLVIEEHNLYPGLHGIVPDEAVVDRMRRDTYIARRSIGETSQQRSQPSPMEVVISYQGWEPVEVADVTNALASLYQQVYETTRFIRANRTTDFLGDQLRETKAALSRQDELISEFNRKHMGSLPQQEAANIATLERLNADLRLNKEQQNELLKIQRMGERNQNSEFGSLANIPGESRLAQLKRQLANMAPSYNAGHPTIIRLQNEIDMLESNSGTVTNQIPDADNLTMIMTLPEEELVLRGAIERLQTQFEQMPSVAQELGQLEHEYSAIRERHLALQQQYEDARLAQSLELEQDQEYQVLEYARPANFSSEPNKMQLIFLAIFLSGVGVFVVAILAEKLDQSFRTLQELREYTAVPVIASIRRMKTVRDNLKSGVLSTLAVMLFAILLLTLTTLAYYAGQHALQVVWIIAGANG